jgi:hypothetical protein
VQAQWPQITADLDHATPAALGLVTAASAKPSDLGLNHQVLACGYGASETEFTVQVYDPNSSQDDGIYIRFDPTGTDEAHNFRAQHQHQPPHPGPFSAPPTPRPRHPAGDHPESGSRGN